MSVVANVAVNLDSTAATRALQSLVAAASAAAQKLNGAFDGIGGKISSLGGKISGLGGSLVNLGTAAAGIGAGALVKGFVDAGLQADRADKTIKSLAGSYGEYGKVSQLTTQAAKEFGIGQTTAAKSVADLYGRLRPMGISLNNIGKTYFGVNKAAALMNLTSADTEGVMLQLSQAMGSGALQGDELRSIMEQLPAVGQAVAKVMGVTVGEVKKLGSDGKITTDVIIKAMDELNKIKPPPPDPFKMLTAAMEDASTAIGIQLLPVITPLIQKISELAQRFTELETGRTLAEALTPLGEALLFMVDAFLKLDPNMQKTIVQFAAIAAAVSLVLVPIGLAVSAIGSIVSAVGATVTFLTGAGAIGPIIAGWAGAIGPAIAGMTAALGGFLAWLTGTLLPGLIAFFSGPAGWIALAVVAVVAMAIAFREPLMDFLKWLGSWGEPVRKLFADLWSKIVDAVETAFEFVGKIIGDAAVAWVGFVNNLFIKPYIAFWQGLATYAVTALTNTGTKISTSVGSWISTINTIFVKPYIDLWNNVLRRPVTQMLNWLVAGWNRFMNFFQTSIITPITSLWSKVVAFIPSAMATARDAVVSIWTNVVNIIRNVINGILRAIAGNINKVIDLINAVIDKYNALPIPGKPTASRLSRVAVPQFAQGGTVNRPTLAMVGEGGEREYIVPESKMAQASANYLAGARGDAVLNGGGGGGGASPVINITTGPVMEFNGQRYVTVADMERAMRATADGVIGRLRTPSARVALGMI